MSKTPKSIINAVLPDTTIYPVASPYHFWALEANNINVFSTEYTGVGKGGFDVLFIDHILKMPAVDLLKRYKTLGSYEKLKEEYEAELTQKSMRDVYINFKALQEHIAETWKNQILFEVDKGDNKKKIVESV